MSVTLQRLVAAQATADGYRFPSGKPWDLFVFGIRGAPRRQDAWDDRIGVIYADDQGQWSCEVFEATTDPGSHALHNGMNPNGAARIVPGQYRRVWQLGKRASNGHPALMQIGPFRIQRDNDKNTTYDEAAPVQGDGAALLLHEPWRDGLATVGQASEGCQVTRWSADARRIFDLVRRQAQAGLGDRVSYTLWDLATTPALAPLFHLNPVT
jgi:hypothetical protein